MQISLYLIGYLTLVHIPQIAVAIYINMRKYIFLTIVRVNIDENLPQSYYCYFLLLK